MDLLNNLLQPDAPRTIITVPGAQVDGAVHVNDELLGEMHDGEEDTDMVENFSYARAYQEREDQIMQHFTASKMAGEGCSVSENK